MAQAAAFETSDRRETRSLAATAIVSLVALLGVVYLTANDIACQAPSLLGCKRLPLSARTIPYVVVVLGMLRAGIGCWIHREDSVEGR